MIDKNKLEEDMKLAYSNMEKCRKEKDLSSCSLCPIYDQRECFSYHFYWANFELSQLINEDK